MNDHPQLLPPTRHSSGGHSPTRQRLHDDILAQTSPAVVVHALSSPTDALASCLDSASPSERDFAMRTATASHTIWEWVDELSDWPWPSDGSAGFEVRTPDRTAMTAAAGRSTGTGNVDVVVVGIMPLRDVPGYIARIDDVYAEMEALQLDEIKSHVMASYILPLSRSTGSEGHSDSSCLRLGLIYNKMDDLPAVITAIVLQTLPNLARLSYLLHIWAIRLDIVQRVPSLLAALQDAELALRSGWTAIEPRRKSGAGGSRSSSGSSSSRSSASYNNNNNNNNNIDNNNKNNSRNGLDNDGTNQLEPAEEEEEEEITAPSLSRRDFEVMRTVIAAKISTPGRSLDYMLDKLEGLSDTLPDAWLERMEVVERGYAEWVAACERRIAEAQWLTALSVKAAQTPSASSRAASPQSRAPPGEERPLVVKKLREPPRTPSPPEDARRVLPSRGRQLLDADESFASSRLQVPTPIKEEQSFPEDDGTDMSSPGSPQLPPLPRNDGDDSDGSDTSVVFHGRRSSHFGPSSEPPEVLGSPMVPRTRVREAEYVGGVSLADSPPSSPPLPEDSQAQASPSDAGLLGKPAAFDDATTPNTPIDGSFSGYFDDSFGLEMTASPGTSRDGSDEQLRQQIGEIIDRIPARIRLRSEPPNLNPPDLQLPKLRKKVSREMASSRRSVSGMSSRGTTPSFTLSPAKNPRPPRQQRGQQDIKVYHLSRSTGEAPIKLFIRCVGDNGERVMVRVGGGWADLSEYLKEYATHHGRRSAGTDNAKVEVRDVPRVPSASGLRPSDPRLRSTPPSRPTSAFDTRLPTTPLAVRKSRRSIGASSGEAPRPLGPVTPGQGQQYRSPSDGGYPSASRSRSNSRVGWVEEDSSFLGLAGPSGKKVEMSEENRAWVESVKEKVRIASSEHMRVSPFIPFVPSIPPPQPSATTGYSPSASPSAASVASAASGLSQSGSRTPDDYSKKKFGELGRVGGTKRLYRRSEALQQNTKRS
ncbi:GAS2 domain protein [Geosmithia morbida]|uniref:GAS2 domain protein n=1 Tax=Geosmithia morbida TaxID=1094350 RepID=A0A9P5D2N9_9HYPO|nr:GAS2 domain protein [Geosmithia morbida]KAF4119689.1 GAS2 domain protein [Geosmithia morbida]